MFFWLLGLTFIFYVDNFAMSQQDIPILSNFILEISLFVIFIRIFDPSSSLGLRASPSQFFILGCSLHLSHPNYGVNVYPSPQLTNNKYEIVYIKGSITHHMWTNCYGQPIDSI